MGRDGQQRLRAARVLVIGAGGLGSPVLMYLAAAGVGTIGVVDDDVVEVSNLQRQIIHSSAHQGRSKVASAQAFMHALNPEVEIRQHQFRIAAQNVMSIIEDYDLVVDGSDNFSTRYLVNDACVLAAKPCVWGSVYQFTGQASVFWGGHGPCYRCLFPEPPPAEYAPNCAEGGVFGAVCGTVGSIQAAEVLKLITGVGEPLLGRVWSLDMAAGTSRLLNFRRDEDCAVCGEHPTIKTPEVMVASCVVAAPELPTITAAELEQQLLKAGDAPDALEVWDIREDYEWAGGSLPGARLIGSAALPSTQPSPEAGGVIIYCQGGVRSARALPALLARGLSVRHLDGGYLAWRALEGKKT